MQLTEAFAEIVALAERLGVTRIDQLSGCWEYWVDKRWWFAVNGLDTFACHECLGDDPDAEFDDALDFESLAASAH
jgi:hypothetical protein